MCIFHVCTAPSPGALTTAPPFRPGPTAVQNAAHAIDNWLSRDAVDPSPDRLALTQMRQDAQQRVDELAAMAGAPAAANTHVICF